MTPRPLILGITLLLCLLTVLPAQARPRHPEGTPPTSGGSSGDDSSGDSGSTSDDDDNKNDDNGDKTTEKKKKKKTNHKKTKKHEEPVDANVAAADAAAAEAAGASRSNNNVEEGENLTPQLALAHMLYFEYAQGVQDYTAEVLETTTDARTGEQMAVRKNLYFLAPATTLTLRDGKAVNYLDNELFGRFLNGVDLAFEKDAMVNGTRCKVVRVTPREGAFKDNIKYYYLAADDFRKIRIRAIKTDSDLKKFWFTNDFTYKTYPGGYFLVLQTEAIVTTDTNIEMSRTKATFVKYEINTGLDGAFMQAYLKDVKLNDTFKD
ncbi:MAG: hypothetical protein ABI743_08450 [bacterium]